MSNEYKKTSEILKKYHLQAKKKYGQNFLVDANILQKICVMSDITKDDIVLEIGPGLGNLTKYLCEYAKRVIAYEVDPDMVTVLKNELTYDNLDIISMDILKSDLSKLKGLRIKIVANLPYYITTAILFKFLESDIDIASYTIMMQKEVANRLTSGISTKDYSALSVIIQYRCETKLLFNVSKDVFVPIPKVDSAVVKLTKKKTNLSAQEEKHFIRFVKSSFKQRRKTLVNNIHNEYGYLKQDIEEVLTKKGIAKNVRAENITVEQFIDLSKAF